MKTNYQIRQSAHPDDVKNYDTQKLRKHFLFSNVMVADEVNMVYSLYDRIIAGGAVPVKESLPLEAIDPLKAPYFLERREMGIVNVGGSGYVMIDGKKYELENKEALYVGKENKEVVFHSNSAEKPAHFYFLSAPAHKVCPTTKVTLADAKIIKAGSLEASNQRTINQLLVAPRVEVCQLQMGMTELAPGSVWNTMPAHVHDRRMEWYFYFEVPQDQAICHFMGTPDETRHIWMHNEEAVVSPNWSIHSAAGTCNYIFIWGMGGENLDYGDVDSTPANGLL
ncbi:4-deoxy-L-threo-5-hexosulose-uronate ketol-isomerase [Bacteroidia bacterium]|nr:4-deoxy-L-threo-5-hexosulose-uronate ketol-isomerase [Bacteroidia bacterium]